jgi:hypothetical protein
MLLRQVLGQGGVIVNRACDSDLKHVEPSHLQSTVYIVPSARIGGVDPWQSDTLVGRAFPKTAASHG